MRSVRRIVFSPLLLLPLLTACAAPTSAQPPTAVDPLPPSDAASPTPTVFILPATSTRSSTFIPTLANNPLPTSTSILADAHTVEEVVTRLFSHGDCALPCWLGVTPGSTSESQLRADFPLMPLGSIDGYRIHSLYMSLRSDGQPNFSTVFYIAAATVIGLNSDIGLVHDDSLDGALSAAMANYSLDGVLRIHGIPTRVYLEPSGPAGTNRLWVFYDQKGLLFSYLGTVSLDRENHYRVCPSYVDTRGLGIYSTSTSGGIDLEMLAGLTGANSIESHLFYHRFFELHAATGYDLASFYAAFSRPDAEVCLTIW